MLRSVQVQSKTRHKSSHQRIKKTTVYLWQWHHNGSSLPKDSISHELKRCVQSILYWSRADDRQRQESYNQLLLLIRSVRAGFMTPRSMKIPSFAYASTVSNWFGDTSEWIAASRSIGCNDKPSLHKITSGKSQLRRHARLGIFQDRDGSDHWGRQLANVFLHGTGSPFVMKCLATTPQNNSSGSLIMKGSFLANRKLGRNRSDKAEDHKKVSEFGFCKFRYPKEMDSTTDGRGTMLASPTCPQNAWDSEGHAEELHCVLRIRKDTLLASSVWQVRLNQYSNKPQLPSNNTNDHEYRLTMKCILLVGRGCWSWKSRQRKT